MPDLDFAERQIIRRRDEKRLQAMEGYCYTTECLRNYILKYFGENPDKPCEDCGNCLRDFETKILFVSATVIGFAGYGRFSFCISLDGRHTL